MTLFKTEALPSLGPKHEKLLDKTLYTVPGTDTAITWADSIEGTLVLGSTGSGKSSGPTKHTALAMMQAKFGMCVLCAKPQEKDRFVEYAKLTGRSKDIVEFNKESGLKFNFLKYELDRKGDGAGEIQNLVNALMNLNEQNKIHQSGGDGREEKFWDNSLRRLISRCITLLILANEEVSIYNMRKIVSGYFRGEDYNLYSHLVKLAGDSTIDPPKRKEAAQDLEDWMKSSFFLSTFQKVSIQEFDSEIKKEESLMVLEYWSTEFPNISQRTQSIVVESFNGVIEPWFNRGILKDHFSGGLSPELLPENIIKENSIVIIDFPVKEYGLAGIYAASIYKSAFQAAMERRDIEKEDNPIPVALMIDEYQQFCSPLTDTLFQVTARSSWIACCFTTQNINNIFYVMGRDNPMPRAKSLLGNLNLKYFASQSDADTNNWASQMIGKHLTEIERVSINHKKEVSKSINQQMEFRITPDEFTTLKTGREVNDFKVQAVVFKAGKTWGEANDNYAVVEFDQKENLS